MEMEKESFKGNLMVAARQSDKERAYWQNQLSGDLMETTFPYDYKPSLPATSREKDFDSVKFQVTGNLFSRFTWMINESDIRAHVILTAVLNVLLKTYTGNNDIIIGTPIYKQDIEGHFINTALILRNRLEPGMNFKELLFRVRRTIDEAVENQNYPIEAIFYDLKLPLDENKSRLFDTVILLENIQPAKYIETLNYNILFSFLRTPEVLEGVVEYKTALFEKSTIRRIIGLFLHLMEQMLFDVDNVLERLTVVPPGEKKQLLGEFNNHFTIYPRDKTIHEIFEEQSAQSPDRLAVVDEKQQLTYRELNQRANCLAGVLRQANVGRDTIVALMADRSVEMIIGILGILKAGAAYMPIDVNAPLHRINFLLRNNRSPLLVVTDVVMGKYSYTALLDFESAAINPVITLPRSPITSLDKLSFPDRSLVDYEKYNRYIGQALVKTSVLVQGSRGCPFNCAFCHNIWPKQQISRSPGNIFQEMHLYYRMGVRRFAFVDDIFNLNIPNTTRLFEMIIENKLKVELLLALRGDILTRQYIDLMVKAGTVRVSMSLETASPRLQTLIGKKLNLKKFRENIEYFCEKYPQVILELNTLHGIPTETREEARMTMDFIKSLKWVHFPYVHVLKIYQNTDMEKIALGNGISREAIVRSENLAYHELPETLPFDKGFSKNYQAEFFNEYFLCKERLLHVLPQQMKILTEDEIVQKYDSYLPVEIKTLEDLLTFSGIKREQLKLSRCLEEKQIFIPEFNRKLASAFPKKSPSDNALRVLLLDLSQYFSGETKMLYDITEPPLGLIYLLSYLNREMPGKVNGRIAKSHIDFDNYAELRNRLEEFKPDVIGVRSLTFFKEFFHKTIALLRQWGYDVPIIAGGPYVTSDYLTILADRNIDLLVLGEGEVTFCQVIEEIIRNNGKLPAKEILKEIPGIAFVPRREDRESIDSQMKMILMEEAIGVPVGKTVENPVKINQPGDLAYVIHTSGSSGNPKGVMIGHGNVNNLVEGLKERIYHQYEPGLRVSLVTPYYFDASIKQVFGSLLLGHTLYIVPEDTRIDGLALRDFYKKHQVEIIDGTPSHLVLLRESIDGGAGGFAVKHFVIGGEAFPFQLARQMSGMFNVNGNRVKITNVYGPTECSDVASSYHISPGNITLRETIPIGKPMPNVRIYIVNKEIKLQPISVVGELCIGGDALGRGYLNHPELTAEKFTGIEAKVEFEGEDIYYRSYRSYPSYIYKTGDLAQWLPDGNIEFVGRNDEQIKIRGFRIEPGEIEKHLIEIENIKEAIVIGRENGKDHKVLCAYFTLKDSDSPSKRLTGNSEPFHFRKILKSHQEFSFIDMGMDMERGFFLSNRLLDYEKGNNGGSLVKYIEKVVADHGSEVAIKSSKKSLDFNSLDKQAGRLAGVIDKTYDDRFQLSGDEQRRYMRQLLLDRWGVESQEKLKSSTVFVAGAGGIGSQIIQQLALLGFGTIIVCDPDVVDLSNLNRQSLHDETRIKMNKALSAEKTINRINPHVNVITYQQKVTRENICRLAGASAVLFDCVDDLETKFIISEYAVERQIPHVLSAMIERNSYAALLHTPMTACFHCLHDRSKVEEIIEMKQVVENYRRKPFPVAAPALFVTAGFVCNEVLKIILGFENPAYNKFFLFNQTGSKRIVHTDGYKQMTYSFNHHFKQTCKDQGFDWDECWRGRFVEELIIKSDPHCPICAKPKQKKVKEKNAGNLKNNISEPGAREGEGEKNSQQVVVSLVEDPVDVITAIMAVLKAGKIYTPLDPTLPIDQLCHLLAETGARLILTDGRHMELAVRFRDKVNKLIPIINIREIPGDKAVLPAKLNKYIPPDQAAYISYQKDSKAGAIPLNTSGLKEYLSKKLPGYMIPGCFVEIDHMPLNRNGKIDRKALPEPETGEPGENHAAAKNRVEHKLAEIWSEVLGIEKDKISMLSNFFDLGGHSLRATTLISKINKELEVRLPLAEVFRSPTIRGLSGYIEGLKQSFFVSIGSTEAKEYYPQSSIQGRLYVLQQMELATTAYNVSLAAVLEGELEKNRLEGIFRELVQRHESLRTSFHIIDGTSVQRVHKKVDFKVEYHDISRAEAEAEAYQETGGPQPAAALISSFIRPFDLSRPPLLRVGLIKEQEQRYILMIDMHHTITDGVSMGLFLRETMALYSGEKLTSLRLQYRDYTQWQTSEGQKKAIEGQKEYWLRQFEDEVPVLDMPIDYPRPAVQSFEGTVFYFNVSGELTRSINQMALDTGTTLYMLLLAIYNILLSKICGQEDIIVGTPIAGRRHADLANIIGMLVNTLAMRNFPDPEKKFIDFLQELKERTLQAFENQEYQFENLVEQVSVNRDTGRNPIFDTMFALQNTEVQPNEVPMVEIPQLQIKPYETENRTSIFDLNMTCIESEEELICSLEYCTKLFKNETINGFAIYFQQILAAVLENPNQKISRIEIITAEEKKKILYDFNGTTESYPADKTIHRLFEEQVRQTPDRVALVGPKEEEEHFGSINAFGKAGLGAVTYKELNEKSNQLARLLSEKGVEPDTAVGVMSGHSLQMVVGLLGILKAGGAYLPIDSNYPGDRIDYMLKDSNAKILLAVPPVRVKGEKIEIIDISKELQPSTPSLPTTSSQVGPANLAYIIYTSGTTGKPKGTMLEHRNLVNLLTWGLKYTNLDFSSVLQFTSISFDVSFQEIFSTLLAGGELCLVKGEIRTDIPRLFEFIEKNLIRTVCLPISLLKIIFNESNHMEIFPRSIRHIQTAGEQVVVSEKFAGYLKQERICLHNHYGPSETHVVTALTMNPADGIPQLPPIGKPLLNTMIYIFDRCFNVQPVGITGELFVGGRQVGRGYLNNPELTFERFINYKSQNKKYKQIANGNVQNYKPNCIFAAMQSCNHASMHYHSPSRHYPIPPLTRFPIYRTGDRARWLPDGNIEFLGRIDHQVKIRGFRIEMGEIENQLLAYDGIKEAVVLSREDKTGDKYLCAYMVAQKELNPLELREFLSGKLPEYMIPAYFTPLEKIPVTPNGKINREALPTPEISVEKGDITPRNQSEEMIAAIWSEVLDLEKEKISIMANFFQLGGHSLKAAVMINKINKAFNRRLSLIEVFMTPTIKGLCENIRGMAEYKYIPVEPVEKREYYTLSPAQERLYVIQQMDTLNTAYNMPLIINLEKGWTSAQLQESFYKLIKRYESLRTSFHMVKEKPVQKIHDHVEFKIEYLQDMRHGNEEEDIQNVINCFIKSFDLARAPLMRCGLIETGEGNGLLMVDMHHTITDGVSMHILAREFQALTTGRELPELCLQYKDYCQWQAGETAKTRTKEQEKFWLNEFSGKIPQLTLPYDSKRPEGRNFEGNSIGFQVNNENTAGLKTLASEQDVTLFMLLLALFNILLSKLSKQEDIVIGVPLAGRRHPDLREIIGMMVNTLALRNYPEKTKTFTAFLEDLKYRTLSAFENQEYPLDTLVEKLRITGKPGHHPLFDVMFALDNIEEDTAAARCDEEMREEEDYRLNTRSSRADMTWAAVEIQGQLIFSVEYSTKLFKEETILRFIDYFQEIIITVIKNKRILIEEIKLSDNLVDIEAHDFQEDIEEFEF